MKDGWWNLDQGKYAPAVPAHEQFIAAYKDDPEIPQKETLIRMDREGSIKRMMIVVCATRRSEKSSCSGFTHS